MQPNVWEMSTGVHYAPPTSTTRSNAIAHVIYTIAGQIDFPLTVRRASFFSGVYSWLVMTFNYLIL